MEVKEPAYTDIYEMETKLKSAKGKANGKNQEKTRCYGER